MINTLFRSVGPLHYGLLYVGT